MKYTIVDEDSMCELIAEVNERCDKGWRPTGGVFISIEKFEVPGKEYTNIEKTYYQAMIKGG